MNIRVPRPNISAQSIVNNKRKTTANGRMIVREGDRGNDLRYLMNQDQQKQP